MAIDTKQERMSAVVVQLPAGRLLPPATGNVDAQDRQQLAYRYTSRSLAISGRRTLMLGGVSMVGGVTQL